VFEVWMMLHCLGLSHDGVLAIPMHAVVEAMVALYSSFWLFASDAVCSYTQADVAALEALHRACSASPTARTLLTALFHCVLCNSRSLLTESLQLQ
jgi:hypothetical protein